MTLETKKALASSLKKLMKNKSLTKITISDLVNDCGVNRQTFYYYFQDIYDLLGWIYKTEAIGSIEKYKTYGTWSQGFLLIFNYVKENRDFCMNTFKSIGREHLEDFLHNEVFKLLIDVIEEISKDTALSTDEKNFIADFYTFAFIGILTSWMRNGMVESPENIVKKVEKLINGNIDNAIHRKRFNM